MKHPQYRRIPRSQMSPLVVTASLQSPVVGDFSLPLDGILYYVIHREALGAQDATAPGSPTTPNEWSGATMPLARCEEHGPMWYYAASWAQWPTAVSQGQDHWNKRLDLPLADLINFNGRRGSVDVASGRYKSFHMPIYYRHALQLKWYAFGVQVEVLRLLTFINGIGKKCEQGWGQVREWRVDRCEEDWSVRDASGRLMRPVPCAGGPGSILQGFRPSYWLPKNQTLCEIPPSA